MADEQVVRIIIEEDGPYKVTGLPIVRKEPVRTENDEPIAWRVTEELRSRPEYLLCRCGQSSNKPFCDSSHEKGFDGALQDEPEQSYRDRSKVLGGEKVAIRDDRSICTHAGFCANAITNVWKLAKGADDDTQIRAQAVSMVERCPSGALTYDVGGEPNDPDLPKQVAAITNGPLWVTGRVEILRPDGTTIERRARITLCRCGNSKNKPFCDGSHADAGFEG